MFYIAFEVVEIVAEMVQGLSLIVLTEHGSIVAIPGSVGTPRQLQCTRQP